MTKTKLGAIPQEWLRGGGSQHLINDKGLLAKLLLARIDSNFQGSVNAAAKSCGISEPQLRRLVQGMVSTRVTDQTFMRLKAFLGDELRSTEMFWRPSSQAAMGLSVMWGLELEHRIISGPFTVDMGPSNAPDGSSASRRVAFREVLTRIRKSDILVTVRTELRELISSKGLTANEKWVLHQLGGPSRNPVRRRRPGIPARRYYLGVLRTIEPLLDAAATGWIERRHVELTDPDFADFIKAGWRREMLLLRREADAVRAQRAVNFALHPKARVDTFQMRMERALAASSKPTTPSVMGLRKIGRGR